MFKKIFAILLTVVMLTSSIPVFATIDATIANVKDYGAVGDGVTNDTNAIQTAINVGKPVYFPQGTYLVSLSSLTLNNNSYLYGQGRLSKIKTTGTADNFAMIKAVSKSNITIDSLCFETPKSTQGALLIASCSNVTVKNCRAVNCELVFVGSHATIWDINNINGYFGIYDYVIDETDYSNNIVIEGNECVGDGVTGRGGISQSAIVITFAKNVRVANNDVTKYIHGIFWFGGNANSTGDFPDGEKPERKCKGITITGNTVHSVEFGGIWGSMGENVAVTGNTVIDCGDVGIDFEGCNYSTASGNTVENCTSAALCTVFENRGIVFSGNSCAQYTAGNYMILISNFLHSDENQDVSFIGNSFVAHNGISAIVSQGVQHLVFEGNTLKNVYVYFHDPQLKHFVQIVSGNEIYFDTVSSSSFCAVRVGPVANGGRVIVTGNNIHTNVTQPAGSTGIYALAASLSAEKYIISNNIVSGWGTQDIFLQSNFVPTSGGTKHIFNLFGNLIDTCDVYQVAPNSAKVLTNANYDSNGNVIVPVEIY